jgi:hypothetical protein
MHDLGYTSSFMLHLPTYYIYYVLGLGQALPVCEPNFVLRTCLKLYNYKSREIANVKFQKIVFRKQDKSAEKNGAAL